jgi:hypothetical protein
MRCGQVAFRFRRSKGFPQTLLIEALCQAAAAFNVLSAAGPSEAAEFVGSGASWLFSGRIRPQVPTFC